MSISSFPELLKTIGIIVSVIHLISLLILFGESLSVQYSSQTTLRVWPERVGVTGILMHVRLFADSGYVIFILHACSRTECLANQSLNITFLGQRVRINP